MSGKPLHILFIASWYPTKELPALGNFIQQHARAAALKNRISVVYAVSSMEIEDGKFEVEETHVGNLSEFIIRFGKTSSSLPIVSHLKKRNAYRNAIQQGIEMAQRRNNSFDLLHVHVIWPAAVAVVPLLKKLQLPLIISEHWSGYLPEDGNFKGPLMKRFSRLLTEKAKLITVVSSRMEKALKDHKLGKTFSLLPNAVDTSIFNLNERNSSSSGLQLLHVSMLVDREKNISGLLRVMKQLENHPSIKLNLVGEGPEKLDHETLAKQLGILNKSVFFLGYKSPSDVAIEMKRSDALVMFSNFEGMPVTIIEAQCCGLPILATKTGSIPMMVNERQGILVDVKDESALASSLLMLKEQLTHFSSDHISSAAISKYGLIAIGNQLNEMYQSILKT